MLSDVVQRQAAVERHRSTLFAPHLDHYLDELKRFGHGHVSLRNHLSLVTRLGEYLATRRIHHVSELREEHLAAFLRRERHRREETTRARRRVSAPTRLFAGFLRHLERRGHWRRKVASPPPVLDRFYRFLETERGLQPATIYLYRHFSNKFLLHLHSDGSAASLSSLKTSDVDAFLVVAGRNYSRKSMGFIGSVMRALLRHLFREGVLEQDLSRCVILPRFYALERLPCALPWKTLRRLPGLADPKTPCGLRDRAILTFLLAYGVRPGEVTTLRLEDIDWRRETIRFRRSKKGRPLNFPLTREVGETIVAYIRRGRPDASAREVFLRCDAPHRALSRGRVVSYLVCRYLQKAGIQSQHQGAGVIRHSLAVHLLRKGHPLKTITDVLGHRDPGTAYHYTKLAIEDLQGVALPARQVLP